MLASLRKIVEQEMPTATCARAKDGGCSGRLTVEHPFGRKIQKRWMFIYLCWHHHLVNLNKELNQHLAYSQASEEEIKASFPKTFEQHLIKKAWLAKKFNSPTN